MLLAPPSLRGFATRNSESRIGMSRTFVAPDKVIHRALHLAETRVGVVHPSGEVFEHPTSGARCQCRCETVTTDVRYQSFSIRSSDFVLIPVTPNGRRMCGQRTGESSR